MDGTDQAGLTAILTGLGSLSYGELAGERMKLGLMIHDPEEEHDCFSDNTFASHYFDALGIRNVYVGRYRRVDGSVVQGPSVSDLVKAKSPEVDTRDAGQARATMDAMGEIYRRGVMVESYDQMIGEGNDEGNATVQKVVDSLLDQTKAIERAVAALDLKSRSSSKAPTAWTIRTRSWRRTSPPASAPAPANAQIGRKTECRRRARIRVRDGSVML